MKRWLIIIGLLMCFQGCGLFKKTVDKSESETQTELQKNEVETSSKSDQSLSKVTSRTIIEFELYPPAFDDSINPVTWPERIKSVKVISDKEEDVKLDIFEEFTKTSKVDSISFKSEKSTEKRVENDATLKANLTWWMWLILLLIIIGILYYVLKKVTFF